MTLLALIARRAPRVLETALPVDDLVLGAEGLGLDSIAIAELLLDCERAFGVRLVDLLDGAPLTIGRIAARLAVPAL